MRANNIIFAMIAFHTKCFHQMAINPYDWKKIDPSAVENGLTISFGKEFKILRYFDC